MITCVVSYHFYLSILFFGLSKSVFCSLQHRGSRLGYGLGTLHMYQISCFYLYKCIIILMMRLLLPPKAVLIFRKLQFFCLPLLIRPTFVPNITFLLIREVPYNFDDGPTPPSPQKRRKFFFLIAIFRFLPFLLCKTYLCTKYHVSIYMGSAL